MSRPWFIRNSTDVLIYFQPKEHNGIGYVNRDFTDQTAPGKLTLAQVEALLARLNQITEVEIGSPKPARNAALLIPLAMIVLFASVVVSLSVGLEREGGLGPFVYLIIFGVLFFYFCLIRMIVVNARYAKKTREGTRKLQQIINEENSRSRPQGFRWSVHPTILTLSLDYKNIHQGGMQMGMGNGMNQISGFNGVGQGGFKPVGFNQI